MVFDEIEQVTDLLEIKIKRKKIVEILYIKDTKDFQHKASF
jgi:hypothetical protein